MGCMFILGGKNGWVMGHSTAGEVYGPVFNSEREVVHFIGFMLTKHNEKEWNKIYNEWFEEYHDDNEEFTGDVKEWNYEKLSIDIDNFSPELKKTLNITD